jgi:hypothetical protein
MSAIVLVVFLIFFREPTVKPVPTAPVDPEDEDYREPSPP